MTSSVVYILNKLLIYIMSTLEKIPSKQFTVLSKSIYIKSQHRISPNEPNKHEIIGHCRLKWGPASSPGLRPLGEMGRRKFDCTLHPDIRASSCGKPWDPAPGLEKIYKDVLIKLFILYNDEKRNITTMQISIN